MMAKKVAKRKIKKPVKKKASQKLQQKHAGGRPTKYDSSYCAQAIKLCKLGATDKEIADFFDVSESTINEWKLKFPKFSESIKKGKISADADVAERLYERAMGFEHDSEEIKVVSLGNGEGSAIERVRVKKIYPPDAVAAMFWLKNRQPDKWRDKKEIDLTTDFDVTIE
jgi:hypothetical protein